MGIADIAYYGVLAAGLLASGVYLIRQWRARRRDPFRPLGDDDWTRRWPR